MVCRLRTPEEKDAIAKYELENVNHRPEVINTFKECILELLGTSNEDILKNFGWRGDIKVGTELSPGWAVERYSETDLTHSYIGRGQTYRDALIDMEVVRRADCKTKTTAK